MKIKLTRGDTCLELEAETEAEIAAMHSVGAILVKRQVANAASGPGYFGLQIELPLMPDPFDRGFTFQRGEGK